MIIISIRGGLGNQLLGYWMYLLLKNRGGCEVKLDIRSWYYKKKGPAHAKYQLEEYFNIRADYATKREIQRYWNVFSKILARLGFRYLYPGYVYVDDHNQYNSEVLKLRSGYFDGHWMDYRYYGAIYELIKKSTKYQVPLNTENQSLLQEIQTQNSVSIHVRRGDYIDLEIYSILDERYFNNCVEQILQKCPDARFYCFSNDVPWCKENLNISNITYVEGNDAGADFYLMSQCKHNIIANSSYSMCAAFLNANKNKIVLRPKTYFVDESYNTEGYFPPEWIVIDN